MHQLMRRHYLQGTLHGRVMKALTRTMGMWVRSPCQLMTELTLMCNSFEPPCTTLLEWQPCQLMCVWPVQGVGTLKWQLQDPWTWCKGSNLVQRVEPSAKGSKPEPAPMNSNLWVQVQVQPKLAEPALNWTVDNLVHAHTFSSYWYRQHRHWHQHWHPLPTPPTHSHPHTLFPLWMRHGLLPNAIVTEVSPTLCSHTLILHSHSLLFSPHSVSFSSPSFSHFPSHSGPSLTSTSTIPAPALMPTPVPVPVPMPTWAQALTPMLRHQHQCRHWHHSTGTKTSTSTLVPVPMWTPAPAPMQAPTSTLAPALTPTPAPAPQHWHWHWHWHWNQCQCQHQPSAWTSTSTSTRPALILAAAAPVSCQHQHWQWWQWWQRVWWGCGDSVGWVSGDMKEETPSAIVHIQLYTGHQINTILFIIMSWHSK